MPSFSGIYLQPGAYAKFTPTTAFPVIPGGLRVTAIVGKGNNTKPIIGEAATFSVSTSVSIYTLTQSVCAITAVTDDTYYTYVVGTDVTVQNGLVKWLNTKAEVNSSIEEPYAGLYNNKTLIVSMDKGTTLITVTFTTTVTTAASVAAYLNNDDTFNNVLIATATTGTVTVVNMESIQTANSSILIGNGSANSILGFQPGSLYLGSQNPAGGAIFYVDYTYAKVTADYVPTYYFNMNDITTDFGEPTTLNTLSLGAEAVFENGAQVVLAAQVDPADGADFAGFKAALDRLKPKACNIVCVQTYDTSLFSYIKSHVDLMSSLTEKMERTAIVGMDDSPSTAQIEGFAGAFGDKRVMLVYPTTVKKMISDVETSVGSYVLAAAIAGIRCNPAYDVAEPLTRKSITGFTEITDNLLVSQKNDLASHGVCIVESDSVGTARVRHALTTNMTTVQNQEYSITEITDYVAQVSRQVLEQMYVGSKILTDTPLMISVTLRVVLQNLIERGIITEYTGITAKQNTTDPTEIDISFSFKPVYPCNYIYIQFTIAV